jgi:hypothetical protein
MQSLAMIGSRDDGLRPTCDAIPADRLRQLKLFKNRVGDQGIAAKA